MTASQLTASSGGGSAGAVAGWSARLMALAKDIKLSHSVFALPFALLAGFLAAASDGRLPGVSAAVLIVVCMVLARTAGMTVNRWADAGFDAVNPRTVGRAVPAGRLSSGFMAGAGAVSGGGFILAASGFGWVDGNWYPLVLSPFVLAWLTAYSFAKRFTWMCHLLLGSALALSPLAAAVAVEPGYLTGGELYLLAGMVMCWVAGFDVIYALQDVDVDRRSGLYSLPACWGVGRALWVSRFLHVLAAMMLVVLWQVSPHLETAFGFGIAGVIVLLVIEHWLIWRRGTRHIHLAFLTINGFVSLILGGLGVYDAVRGVLTHS